MSSRFYIPGVWLSRVEELGVSRAEALRRARLPAALLQQEKVQVSTEEFFALWVAVAELSGDPAIGLKLGGEWRVERYDPVAIAAVHARSFRDALERMARYKRLICPEEIYTVTKAGECRVHFRWLFAKVAVPELLVDMCFAWVLGIARHGTGRAIEPLRVEFRRRRASRAIYEKHFGCAVKFGAPQNALVFRAADVERPFLTHNADLLGMLAPQLEAELAAQRAQQSPPQQVKTILKRLIAGQRPDLEDVAREMHLTARTLQRRLAASGLTYQQVLEEARRELARHYLRHSALELNETAYLLGYADANSFFRAFRGWEGKSPGAWREEGMNGAKAPPPARRRDEVES